jgi:PilZ domain
VLLFKRILNFSKESVQPGDKRQIQRYAVGQRFPFKAILNLTGHDGEGKPILNDEQGQDWAGRLVNMSASGASIQVHSAAIGSRGEPCRFKLSLDNYRLEIPGTIAHFRTYPQYTLCGFSFNFPDFETGKAYRQLLEPVSIGASLVPVDAKKVKQDTEGLQKEQYRGTAAALLNVWRQAPGGGIHSFDFRMNDYGVRWSEGRTEVEAYGMFKITPSGKKPASPFVQLTEVQHEEVRWLFCLAVPNIAKTVPSDIRKFLAELVA